MIIVYRRSNHAMATTIGILHIDAILPLVMLSYFLYSSVQYMEVKRAGKVYGSWTISFFRNLVGAVASVLVSVLNKRRVGSIYGQRKNFKWLVVRGILGGISINAAFFAVQV